MKHTVHPRSIFPFIDINLQNVRKQKITEIFMVSDFIYKL